MSGRIWDGTNANYLSRASLDFGLNGLTECSYAFWLRMLGSTGTSQRLIDKQNGAVTGAPFRAQYLDSSSELTCSVHNGITQSPDWSVKAPTFRWWVRVLFTFKRNAITSADGLIYYNGVSQTISTFQANSYASGFTLGEASDNFYVGVRAVTFALPAWCEFAWVTVWNRQLTADEAVLDYGHPRAVMAGMVSGVEINPETDHAAAGGSFSITGTLPVVTDPIPLPVRRVFAPNFQTLVAA